MCLTTLLLRAGGVPFRASFLLPHALTLGDDASSLTRFPPILLFIAPFVPHSIARALGPGLPTTSRTCFLFLFVVV